MRKTKLVRRGRLTSYRCASDAAFYTASYAVEGSCKEKGGRIDVRDGCSSISYRDSFREDAAGTRHARGSHCRCDWEGDSSCVRRDEFCKGGDGDAGGERRFSGLRLLGGEESLGEAVEQEARRQGCSGFPLVHGLLPHSPATELTCRRRCPDRCEERRNRFTAAAGDPSGNVSALFTVQYCATPQHGSPPPALSRVRGPTAPSTQIHKAAQFHNEISSRGSESFLANVAGAAPPSTSQVSGVVSAGTTGTSGVRPGQLGTIGCCPEEVRQLPGSDASSTAPRKAAAAVSQDVSAAAAASSFGTWTAKDLGGTSQMGRQPLPADGSENAVVSLIAAAPSAVAASTSALRPASRLATPGAAAFAREHSDAWRRAWGRRQKSVSRIGSTDADNASGSRATMRLLRGKSSSEREEAGSDEDDGDSCMSPLRDDSVQRDARSYSKDMEMSQAASAVIGGGNDRDVFPSNRALQSGRKAHSFRVCWDRCVANLRKTWWPRLNRGIRIGAITALALHLSVSKSLPGIGGILGQDWCINTYSLASTVLPEQSGAVISGLWVWVFTLACIAMLTFLLFPVLGFGATLGRILCLLLFLLIVSWLSVMRLPLIYKVPPFDTDVNTHSLTSFAYLYIPYTTASVILSQQYRAFDTDLKTGLQYVVEMNTGVLFTSLLGWALFLLQVVLPPWSSQRHIVRTKLSSVMGKVAEAINDISESFVQLRRVLLSKNTHAPAARENGYSHSLDDLRAASRALQRSCQPLYTAIGSQTQLRVSIVASSTEPYLMYPGPAVFLFPFFARCCEVLIHNCMNVITLARHIDTLARDPLPVRLDADAALANILLRTEPLLCTTMTAYQLCAELVSLRPDTLHRAAFKAKLRAGLEQLDCIDSQVSATFGLLRSPSMQEVSARQLGTADDVSVCLQRLLSRVSVGSNMGGSCPSEASAGYYPASGVSATLERVDNSLLRTWSQGEDLLPMRYNKGTERSEPLSATAAHGLVMSEATADHSRGGGAAAQEGQPQRQRPGFPLSGAPLSQKHQQNAASVAAGTTATAEVAAGGTSVGVLRSRRLLRYFGLLKQAATIQPGKSDNKGATHSAPTASDGDAAVQDSRSAAAAAAGLEVGEVEMGQTGAHHAEDTPSLLLLGSTVRGSAVSFAPSNPDEASRAAAAAAAQTLATTAWGGAPAVAACTAPAAAGTGPSREIAPTTPGGVPAGAAAAAGAAVTRGKGWGWDQGAGSSLKLELHPIAEEPEQPHGKLAARKILQEKGEAGKDVGGTPMNGTPTAQQTPKLSSGAGGLPPTAAPAGGASPQRQLRRADDSASADISVRTAARAPPGGVPTPPARLITAAGADGAPSLDSTVAKDSPRSLEGCAVPSSTAAARLAPAAGKASSGFLGGHQTMTTTGAADASTGGKLGAVLSDKEKRKDSLYLSGYDPSSSPPGSSPGPFFMPLHRTDSPSVSSSPAGRLTLFPHADVLSNTASLVPSSPLVPPAAAAAPASPPWAVTRSHLPGVSPHFLSGTLQHHHHSPLCHVGLPPASAGAASSDATLLESAPLFVNDQMESTSPPLAPSTPGGGAVATALTAATIAASAAGGTHLPATSSCANLGTASSLTDSVGPVSGASAALLSSETVAFATGGRHAPLAGPPSPSAFSMAVESAAPSGGNSTSVTLLRSPASLAVAPVVTPRLASNEVSFGPNFLPMQRRPSQMDARTSDPAVIAGSAIPRATSPAAISPSVDAHEPANLGGAGPTRGTATGGWEIERKREEASRTTAAPVGAGVDAETGNEAPAMSRTSAPPSQTATPRVAGSNVSRDAEARGEGLKSGLLSLFSLETSKASGAQSRGSPIPRLFQPPDEQQEHAHGESRWLLSNLSQEERRLNSGGTSTPSSSSISSSTPSAESSTSSIDMDAVLTNLLQQNEDRQEAGLRGTVDSAASSVVFPITRSPAPPPATPLPVHSPAVSPPAVGGRVAVTGTSPLQSAAPLSNATIFLAPEVSDLAAPSGTLAAEVSPRVSPAAVATPAGATPAAATTVAGSAFQAAGNAAAAELVGGGEGRSTKSSAAAESPVLARVGEDLRRLLSIPRRSIARLASMQREDRELLKTGAAAAGVAEQEKSTGYKRGLAVEEESALTSGRKHRKHTDASISTGDRRRSTQPAGVLSPRTAAPGATAGGSGVVEKGLTLLTVQAAEKVADKRESRMPLRKASIDVSAAAGFGEERRELAASRKTPVLGHTGIGIREKQEKERVRQKMKWLGRKGSSCLRIKRVWKRTPPWAWLATRVPWSLVSVQRRQRQREEDLQALRALAHSSGREVGGSAAWSSVGVGQKRRLAAPADFSTTAELRQELRISKLIVSLYRICAMDTQELCSTVRGLCLAVVSPSWEGARQNAKMMMLSLAMIFIQLFFGLRNLVRADKWKWKGSEAFYRDVEAVHCMKLILGLGVLFGCCLFYGPQIDRFLGGPHISGGPQTAKQWMILGFLCAHSFTYEGNTHKGLKRAVGTLLGGLAVELALMVTSNYVLLLFLTSLSIAVAVFVFASPEEPSSEFDREFGYIGQVFIWTVTFILNIIWIYEGLVPFPYLRDTVVRSRICGNVVGIGFSMVLTYVPPVFSAERAARTYCATLLKTCRRCILLMNAAFLSLTTSKEKPDKPPQVDVLESTNESTLASCTSLGPSSSPLTAINKPFHWARLWKFRRARPLARKRRDWKWIRKDKDPQKDAKKAFHYYLQQAEQLLRHHSTRLLVVARMLYAEGESSEHSPVWRVDRDVGEIMNRVEYLVMSVVDAVDNLCQLAMGTDPDLAALLHGSAVLARESVLTLLQQDRRNWERVMRCRAGKALLINMVRMVKAQSVCSHLLAREIQAAGLHFLDRIINWDWLRFPATMPPKYIRAVLRYIQGRSSIERYTNRVYESLAVCGRELREQGPFELDEWKGAIFSVLLIMEKCETRTYFMDEIHRFQLRSACRVVFANENQQLMLELFGSSSVPGTVEEAGANAETVRLRSCGAPSAPERRALVGKTRAYSYPLRGSAAVAADVSVVKEMYGAPQKKRVSRRRSV